MLWVMLYVFAYLIPRPSCRQNVPLQGHTRAYQWGVRFWITFPSPPLILALASPHAMTNQHSHSVVILAQTCRGVVRLLALGACHCHLQFLLLWHSVAPVHFVLAMSSSGGAEAGETETPPRGSPIGQDWFVPYDAQMFVNDVFDLVATVSLLSHEQKFGPLPTGINSRFPPEINGSDLWDLFIHIYVEEEQATIELYDQDGNKAAYRHSANPRKMTGMIWPARTYRKSGWIHKYWS